VCEVIKAYDVIVRLGKSSTGNHEQIKVVRDMLVDHERENGVNYRGKNFCARLFVVLGAGKLGIGFTSLTAFAAIDMRMYMHYLSTSTRLKRAQVVCTVTEMARYLTIAQDYGNY
jgi:hypothetical protein